MSNPAKWAYRDSELREVQLAEFFIDGVSNSFIKEDVARVNPTTLSEVLSSARESERLYERLPGCQETKEKHTKRFPGKAGWRQERVGLHTLLRAPKSEDYRGNGLGRAVVVIVVKNLYNELSEIRKGMHHPDPVSESTEIETKNVAQVQLKKVRITGPQQSIYPVYICMQQKDTSVRTVQSRKIEI